MIDLETGKSLGIGETGEVVLTGPQVMLGYLKNQEATDNMVRDGWLHTGKMILYIAVFFILLPVSFVFINFLVCVGFEQKIMKLTKIYC